MNIYESINSFNFKTGNKTMTEELVEMETASVEEESPNVAVNLPYNASLSFNFEPSLEPTHGEFTDLDDLDDTVKADPFADSVVPAPVDPDAEPVEAEDEEEEKEEGDIETVTDSDEARFLTLQDLM